MTRTLRRIHGSLSIGLASLLCFYALSGWLLVHPIGSESLQRTERSLPAAVEAGPAGAAERIAAELDPPGRLVGEKHDETGGTARFASASTDTAIRWRAGSPELEIETRTRSAGRALSVLHRVHGGEGGARYLLFAVLVEAVALAMLALPVTGILLWWKTRRDRRSGLLLLAASSALCLALLARLMWWP